MKHHIANDPGLCHNRPALIASGGASKGDSIAFYIAVYLLQCGVIDTVMNSMQSRTSLLQDHDSSADTTLSSRADGIMGKVM